MKTLFTAIALVSFAAACTHGGHHTCKHGSHHKGKHHHKWEKLDVNKDGKVSKKEFDSMHGGKFNMMDANKDGFIDMKEKEMMMKKKHRGHNHK